MTITRSEIHQLVDPKTYAIVPEFTLSERLEEIRNKKVGLIDDSKENAKELLEEFSSLLNEKYAISASSITKNPQLVSRRNQPSFRRLQRSVILPLWP